MFDIEAENVPAKFLGVFMIVAGLSKLFILEYWTGYEPRLVLQLVPISAENLVLLGGLFEAFLGAGLVYGRKTKYFAGLTVFWLSIIALQVVRIGMYALAVRDFGLVLFTLTVFLNHIK
ncbi:MAG: DoxX family membrane protein [Nanohaloarchaea archaeon]|nr:DoxX family membrane protein [Candidatus Nanohaloarchaea archaeon]